jgi:rod shape-determining protein MreD
LGFDSGIRISDFRAQAWDFGNWKSRLRWITYFILAYVTLGVQIGAGTFMRYQGAAPNLLLLAVIFIALNAPRDAALLGAVCLGLMQDLLTQQQPGLYAFSYGLVGMFIVSTGDTVNRDHILAHITLALVGGLMTMGVLLAHGWLHPSAAVVLDNGPPLRALRMSPGLEFTRVVYTAALAPLVLGVLQRFRRQFGFQQKRRAIKS